MELGGQPGLVIGPIPAIMQRFHGINLHGTARGKLSDWG